jgi:hypothetical protein
MREDLAIMKKVVLNGRYEDIKTVNFVKTHTRCKTHKGWQEKIEGNCAECYRLAPGRVITWTDYQGLGHSAIVVKLLDGDVLVQEGPKVLPHILPSNIDNASIKIAGLD